MFFNQLITKMFACQSPPQEMPRVFDTVCLEISLIKSLKIAKG